MSEGSIAVLVQYGLSERTPQAVLKAEPKLRENYRSVGKLFREPPIRVVHDFIRDGEWAPLYLLTTLLTSQELSTRTGQLFEPVSNVVTFETRTRTVIPEDVALEDRFPLPQEQIFEQSTFPFASRSDARRFVYAIQHGAVVWSAYQEHPSCQHQPRLLGFPYSQPHTVKRATAVPVRLVR